MLFTSEQVSAGHPDKICDQIADAIVTDCLRHDRDSRVAVECMIKDCMIFIAGEITSTHAPDYEVLSREVLTRVGDPDPEGLGLKDVDYNRVSAYGHFGKAGLPWEA